MTDEEAMLRGVLEDPLDDLPRLVLADWWADNGKPERAEFVRVQCELAKMPPPRKRIGFERYVMHPEEDPQEVGTLLIPHGPNYWTMSTPELLVPGERVDVRAYARNGSNHRTEHGLRVVNEYKDGARSYVVKKDALSVPEDGRITLLRKREQELWLGGRMEWASGAMRPNFNERDGRLPYPITSPDACNKFEWWSRGFVKHIEMRTTAFLHNCEAIFSQHPIEEVVLIPEDLYGLLIVVEGFDDTAAVLVDYGRKKAGLPPLRRK